MAAPAPKSYKPPPVGAASRPARERKRTAAAAAAGLDLGGYAEVDEDEEYRRGRNRAQAKARRELLKARRGQMSHDQQQAAWLDDRTERARKLASRFRCGALTVHEVGRVAPLSSVGFHAANRIYPLGYRATRIYWSFARPLQRTLYVLEVVDKTTTVDLKPAHRAEFRVTAVDAPRDALAFTSPGDAVRAVEARVRATCERGPWLPRSRGGKHSRRKSRASYGLGDDGGGFFGFAIPAVRARCEDLPGAVALGLYKELMSDDDRRRVRALDAAEGYAPAPPAAPGAPSPKKKPASRAPGARSEPRKMDSYPAAERRFGPDYCRQQSNAGDGSLGPDYLPSAVQRRKTIHRSSVSPSVVDAGTASRTSGRRSARSWPRSARRRSARPP